ncbi:MAG: hypothetical protein MPI95_06760 [Nitrosopumilus sp.]|nr:hypothetical protein [Nitrosopumilus sp.]CAI9832352.1 conserved hypothetical protein [Nitrosopumilaceae archaeon]MDA7942021.1 hypothetical protein [Nitrosopumilus sp.]MDA7944070.1 hypothetical protein [Nitrosopumilus sp.]MDA7945582.1 hypothetical protein [Nitrosopumilus sp.]
MIHVYVFIAAMWGLILAGGGIAVLVLRPLEVTGFGPYDAIAGSVLKAAAALAMVAVWVAVLAKVKGMVFRRQMRWDSDVPG